ncbi:MAG: hypothetical protein M0014_12185 [Actinomycetota bacterium]|jgi:hypothetical protein|nr:hypothetical protein [Actinomycetota bacterium]
MRLDEYLQQWLRCRGARRGGARADGREGREGREKNQGCHQAS